MHQRTFLSYFSTKFTLQMNYFILSTHLLIYLITYLLFFSSLTENEAQIKEIVKELQAEAVQKFSTRNYNKAIELFSEALNYFYSIYPHSHPECIKIAKSIEACQKKSLSLNSNQRDNNRR